MTLRERPEWIATYEPRFLAKVEKGEDCWLWKGAHSPKGYGHIQVDGRYEKAHRLAYRLYVGPIGEGLVVCHACDVPACVNPAHLWLGTTRENILDAKAKGRLRNGITCGEANRSSKLTAAQVEIIRSTPKLYGSGRALAREFGVNEATICDVRARRRWRHA